MEHVEKPTTSRSWRGVFQVPPNPLHGLYFAMFMLLVSVVLQLVAGTGVAFAAAALGILFWVAGQMRAQEPDER